MQSFRQRMGNVTFRRKAWVVLSGALILAALAAEHLLAWIGPARLLLLAAAVVAGWEIALRAVRSLRHRQVTIDLLVTIAAGGALVIGEFWEAAAVTFLFILGAYLEARTLTRTRQVIGSLLELAPDKAVVVRAGRQVEVLPHEVEYGETVLIRPGDRVAVDGEVLSGNSAVDESAITGEPMPEDKSAGSPVYAGTLNGHGLLTVRATGVGADTTLARIIRRVEQAQEEKAPTQRFIERFARWYTPLIIALSGAALLLTRNVELALTLLVIGCPGALVISTPVSVIAGIGRAARAGILIKGGEYLENAGKISVLALDKTGTLTQGRPVLTEVTPIGAKVAETLPALASVGAPEAPADPRRETLRLAAIAEAGSEHLLARAILQAAEAELGEIPLADAYETFPGRGVRATLGAQTLAVGSAAWLESEGVDIPPEAQEYLAALRAEGRTAVLLAVDGQVSGVLGISDPLRAEGEQLVAQVQAAGVGRVVLVTGDDARTAGAVARAAGIDEVYAGQLPEQKLEVIRGLQAEGHVVAMVGDGINDAPALAAADIGLAMGAAGSGIAIETAGIALMADDLSKIPEAIRLSRATLRNIRQNVAIALVTVAALLAGVLMGEVHMALGMLVHQASVLIVILNGMRLLR